MSILNMSLVVGLAIALAACNTRPTCLTNEKDTAVVIDIENICEQGRRSSCIEYSRLRMKRDSDGTICAMYSYGWKYKVGDKIRGPM